MLAQLVKVLIAVDSFLIERCLEPITWRIEYYTGRNNFSCARWIMVFYPAGLLASIFSIFSLGVLGIIIFFLATVMVALVSLTQYLHSLRIEQSQRPGVRNWLRMTWRLRYTMIALVILLASVGKMNVPWDIAMASYCLQQYLLACTPMPPKWKQAQDEKAQERKLVAQSA